MRPELEAFTLFMRKSADLGDPTGSGVESISGKVSGSGGEPGISPLQTAGPQSKLPVKINRTAKGVDTSQTGIVGGGGLGGGPSAQL
jgi:hypothetical protein